MFVSSAIVRRTLGTGPPRAGLECPTINLVAAATTRIAATAVAKIAQNRPFGGLWQARWTFGGLGGGEDGAAARGTIIEVPQ
jgi:hypothetical protein